MHLFVKCACVAVLGFNLLSVCLSLPQQQQQQQPDPSNPGAGEPQLKIEVMNQATDCPRKSKDSDILVIHYEGFYDNGTKFDSR